MIGRIVRSADFERVLGKPSRVRSSHFAVHHVAANPSQPAKPVKDLSTAGGELSTDGAQPLHIPVDDRPPEACWLGAIVPKRHAKRAVTRSLLKRQIRQAFDGQPQLPPGLWVVRLRAPFDRKLFPSASSDALRAAARAELTQLVGRVLARPQG
jgi:ribonuclease P protein component